MNKWMTILSGCIGLSFLSACSLDGVYDNDYHWSVPDSQENNQPYPEGYDTLVSQDNSPTYNRHTPQNVAVPESYHVGITNTPMASKDEDKRWVETQNPEGYTIEIAEDSKPAHVANTLQQTPKNEHSAEVKSQQGSYLGLYGSYSSKEAAENKLNTLPENIKQNARVKNWRSVQKEIE